MDDGCLGPYDLTKQRLTQDEVARIGCLMREPTHHQTSYIVCRVRDNSRRSRVSRAIAAGA